MPVAPDFARTAYSMQGFTLPEGKVDLNMSSNTDPVTGYIALSRFKKADDVVIMQPFDISVFKQGAADQPVLLLRHLHGEDISAAVEARGTCQEQQKKRQKTKHDRAAAIRERDMSGKTTVAKHNKRYTKSDEAKHNKRFPKSDENMQRKKGKRYVEVQCVTCGKLMQSNQFSKSRFKNRNDSPHHLICNTCLTMSTSRT
jgi:hypothetical protein